MISRCCSSFTFCTNLDCFIYHGSVLSILQYTLVCGAFCHLFFCTSNTEQHLGRVIYVQSSILESHQPAAHIKLFLSFICYSVLSILQYISVWCLLSSFLLHFLYRAEYWKSHLCAGQYIAITTNLQPISNIFIICMHHLL